MSVQVNNNSSVNQAPSINLVPLADRGNGRSARGPIILPEPAQRPGYFPPTVVTRRLTEDGGSSESEEEGGDAEPFIVRPAQRQQAGQPRVPTVDLSAL